jgi:hypothetical protein
MEFLYTENILSDGWFTLVFLAGAGALSTGLFGVVGFFDGYTENKTGVILLLVCTILIVTAVAVVNLSERITQHKVVITDMSTFDTEKYEIIDAEGRIFTIKER